MHLLFSSTGLLGMQSYGCDISYLQGLRSVRSWPCLLYTVSVHVKSAHWQEISGSQEGPQTNALCRGFWASWLLRVGLGASLSDSAKKVSKPTPATCSPPSESTLPVWEVRERDTGQFQESIVDISTETEGVQEPICRLYAPVHDSLHVLHCLQTAGLSGLFVHSWWFTFLWWHKISNTTQSLLQYERH